MNIFYFTHNPVLNAKLLDDKRVVKMVVETTQLLSSAIFMNGETGHPYKPTHEKHPCTKWTAQSMANWNWLKNYGLELAKEYTRRYGRIHKCQPMIELMECPKIKDNKLYPLPQCMPEQYRGGKSSRAYMRYYIGEKLNPNYFKHCDERVLKFWEKLKNLSQ